MQNFPFYFNYYSIVQSRISKRRKFEVSVKFSSVIHLTVDNYYLRGFVLSVFLHSSGQSPHW